MPFEKRALSDTGKVRIIPIETDIERQPATEPVDHGDQKDVVRSGEVLLFMKGVR